MEDGTFDVVERDIQETLDELMGDQSLEKFKTEYGEAAPCPEEVA